MTERQTLSFISKSLERAGLHPKTKYGQNFLVDLNLLDILIKGADIQKTDVVLEVGTGMGSLSKLMAPLAGAVVTVEIDRDLQALAAKELRGNDNVTMLSCDALRNKNHMREEVLTAVREKMASIPGSHFKLIANLPYNVATPIISNLLTVDPFPDRMVVTIQKELAQRIVAEPSCKDYSALTIWMQSLCDCEILRILPPSVFWPSPKVDSAIIRVTPNPAKRGRIVDLEYYHTKLRALFFHRRKFLRSQLFTATQDELSKPQIDEILAKLNLEPNLRAEQLSVEQIIELLDATRLMTLANPVSDKT
ncbi:MAG: 16S rRNA (adenine(1518)-N(6)/adenine(1519)-N(6))-dimethyltransferase RsmA [Planctomycetota bacterium]|nr:16S rRNA (adenine(1518)-N(6)/adenine(1519)-N(6))-dimethyltransferase RsmA [Planctomycetota bacterium]